jgi:hypothetical protein
MGSGEVILSRLAFNISPKNHSSTYHSTHILMLRVIVSKPYASSVIIKDICGHGIDRSDSGIFILDCGTT